MLAEIEGEFLVNSTYSESPPLSPKLAAGVSYWQGQRVVWETRFNLLLVVQDFNLF